MAGPFREGQEFFLSCQVTKGNPAPKVSWWHSGYEIPGTTHRSSSAVINNVLIRSTPREFYGTKFICKADVSPLVDAVQKEVTVHLVCTYQTDIWDIQLAVHRKYTPMKNPFSFTWFWFRCNNTISFFFCSCCFHISLVKPVKVNIVSPNEILTAAAKSTLQCETWGSEPSGMCCHLKPICLYVWCILCHGKMAKKKQQTNSTTSYAHISHFKWFSIHFSSIVSSFLLLLMDFRFFSPFPFDCCSQSVMVFGWSSIIEYK